MLAAVNAGRCTRRCRPAWGRAARCFAQVNLSEDVPHAFHRFHCRARFQAVQASLAAQDPLRSALFFWQWTFSGKMLDCCEEYEFC